MVSVIGETMAFVAFNIHIFIMDELFISST